MYIITAALRFPDPHTHRSVPSIADLDRRTLIREELAEGVELRLYGQDLAFLLSQQRRERHVAHLVKSLPQSAIRFVSESFIVRKSDIEPLSDLLRHIASRCSGDCMTHRPSSGRSRETTSDTVVVLVAEVAVSARGCASRSARSCCGCEGGEGEGLFADCLEWHHTAWFVRTAHARQRMDGRASLFVRFKGRLRID